MEAWRPQEIDSTDVATWEYTERDKHFWPPEGLVPEDAKLIVDVGANVGFSTGLLADAWREAKVIGIEMDYKCVDTARRHLAFFGDRVEVIEAAVGWPERVEEGIFNISSPVSRLRPYEIEVSGYTEYRNVNVLSLDHVLKNAGVFGQQIDFLKMDIEGSEYEVMRDGGKWPYFVKVLNIESHIDPGDKLKEIYESFGFKITYNHYGSMTGYRE